jgi:hypothetical protein
MLCARVIWRNCMQYEADRGYLIVAGITDGVDYISCAETLAKSLKYWHPDVKICLVTDHENYANPLFDYVRQFPQGNTGGWSTDWQVFYASPFHETVKLEADMVVSGPIDHWWPLYRNKPVWISTGARDFHGTTSTVRHYRKIFDHNNLPDVYNAITYWRVSPDAQRFFNNVKQCFEDWDKIKLNIKLGSDEIANTDLIYALNGSDFVTPGTGPQIVHMKPRILGTSADDWAKELTWEVDDGVLRINGHNQHGFVHYHQKELAQQLGQYYD